MGSDMAMNPPKPVWEWSDITDEDDVLLTISVALENSWTIQARKRDANYRVGIHKGEYI